MAATNRPEDQANLKVRAALVSLTAADLEVLIAAFIEYLGRRSEDPERVMGLVSVAYRVPASACRSVTLRPPSGDGLDGGTLLDHLDAGTPFALGQGVTFTLSGKQDLEDGQVMLRGRRAYFSGMLPVTGVEVVTTGVTLDYLVSLRELATVRLTVVSS